MGAGINQSLIRERDWQTHRTPRVKNQPTLAEDIPAAWEAAAPLQELQGGQKAKAWLTLEPQ